MSAFCDRLVTAPLSYTHTGLGAAHISRLMRSQVRYFKCRSAVCTLIMDEARFPGFQVSFFPGASALHRDKNISTFQNAASAPHLLVTESAADGCLATTNASGAQPPERFGKKGESSAPSVFHAFLGAICERPLLCCCVPLCSLTHRTLRREQRARSGYILANRLPTTSSNRQSKLWYTPITNTRWVTRKAQCYFLFSQHGTIERHKARGLRSKRRGTS